MYFDSANHFLIVFVWFKQPKIFHCSSLDSTCQLPTYRETVRAQNVDMSMTRRRQWI